MVKRLWMAFYLAVAISCTPSVVSFADTATDNAVTTMENCGAYLFEWRPVDCGNGRYFAILVGGNSIAESNVILNRGYDYAYTFNPQEYSRPWGEVPALVNVNGMWAIPENRSTLPEGTQPTLQIVLYTNNGNLDTKYRYIDVVSLPGNVSASSLPAEVRKYLINVDGSDAGAYDNTNATGWRHDEGSKKWYYIKPDGTWVKNGWLSVDDELYYMDADGYMLADTITPDGYYVNSSGQKQEYLPGWMQNERGWKYVLNNGYYAASTWVKDTDGKWYYFDMGGYMRTDYDTPDGYHVGSDGAWDGQPARNITSQENLGPGAHLEALQENWEEDQGTWKYRQADGTYVSNRWFQAPDGKWYYFGADSIMLANTKTPDGYYVGADGAWDEQSANEN